MSGEKQIEYIISTLAIENLKASDEAIKMCMEMDNGNTDINSAIQHILEYHGIRERI